MGLVLLAALLTAGLLSLAGVATALYRARTAEPQLARLLTSGAQEPEQRLLQLAIADPRPMVRLMLFDKAVAQYAAYLPTREAVVRLRDEMDAPLMALTTVELRHRCTRIERELEDVLQRKELNGAVYEDLILLKSLYLRYQGQLHACQGER